MRTDLFKTVLSVAIAGLCTYLANLTVPILVLICFMVLDWVTGLTAAWVHGELNRNREKGMLSRHDLCCHGCGLSDVFRSDTNWSGTSAFLHDRYGGHNLAEY